MKKWWVLSFYLVILIIGILNKDLIFAWIQKSDSNDLPIMFFLSVFLAAIPFIPFTLFAGVMGAKYGVLIGTLINWFGGTTAAILYFLLARIFFRSFFSDYIKRMKGIQRFQHMLEKNAFIAILLARLIAIFPPPVINIYTGVSKISFGTYLIATAFGLVPPMFMIAFSGEQIFSSILHLSIGIFVYLLFLLSIFLVYKFWFMQSSKLN
ncbi:VTT domain-containing protein [Bacillus sp. DTU_2020_1000418_1_SI_GHA_SEK_038]|uniref:TVP38/TMEM64 family protein n=1 Tax=Bacillus sp. DTU_2020_1000418_1_SI_GHA_SEK_038 TaxID=3077585 RepID=UPI0028EE8516|nr:VTT domain-containing protein [Bacillus sp. DTU_2020_1000418_1_SI_GHA_SEK_038]WNS74921.1 VTT domain-containing protein [Bacillus sp. DTU_2020_1000418_1_SI_GHA_SEK_038]